MKLYNEKKFVDEKRQYLKMWGKAQKLFDAEKYHAVFDYIKENSLDEYKGHYFPEYKDYQYRKYMVMFSRVMLGNTKAYFNDLDSDYIKRNRLECKVHPRYKNTSYREYMTRLNSIKDIESDYQIYMLYNSKYFDEKMGENIDIILRHYEWYFYARLLDKYLNVDNIKQYCLDYSNFRYKRFSLNGVIKIVEDIDEVIPEYNYLIASNLKKLEREIIELNNTISPVTKHDIRDFCQLYREKMVRKYGKKYCPEKLREKEICNALKYALKRSIICSEKLEEHVDIIISIIEKYLTRPYITRTLKYKKNSFDRMILDIKYYDDFSSKYFGKISEMVKIYMETDFTSENDSDSDMSDSDSDSYTSDSDSDSS